MASSQRSPPRRRKLGKFISMQHLTVEKRLVIHFNVVKGNAFKNKRVLMESIDKSKAEKAREKTLSDQFEAKHAKSKASRDCKFARHEERLAQEINNAMGRQYYW